MISLDGSRIEGGGQIVRTALAASALTMQGFEVVNIRSGREKSGLKQQHLTAVNSLKKMCNAQVSDIQLGSTSLKFVPGKLNVSSIEIDIRTAGSITLLLQALMMPLFFNKTRVDLIIKGGTDVIWSPSIDYLKFVLLPHLRKFVKSVDIVTKQRGNFPRGGGEISVSIRPKFKFQEYPSFNVFRKEVFENVPHFKLEDQGKLIKINGVSHASRNLSERNVAERQADSAKTILKSLGVPVSIQPEYNQSLSAGSGITLWAIFSTGKDIEIENPIILGSCNVGELGIRAEDVGMNCAKDLINEINRGSAVDSHLSDQLIPWLMFGGVIDTKELTNHSRTNLWTINNFIMPAIKEEHGLLYCKDLS